MESKQQQPQKLQQIEKIVCVPNEFYDEIDHIPILKEPNLVSFFFFLEKKKKGSMLIFLSVLRC